MSTATARRPDEGSDTAAAAAAAGQGGDPLDGPAGVASASLGAEQASEAASHNNSGSDKDAFAWETSKENMKPLKRGRKVDDIRVAFGGGCSSSARILADLKRYDSSNRREISPETLPCCSCYVALTAADLRRACRDYKLDHWAEARCDTLCIV